MDVAAQKIHRIRRLAVLLDACIKIPGTDWKIGIDPLIGLIPGVGDATGALLSSWVVVEAARSGVSRVTITRMIVNLALEAVIGAVPLLGDLFDASTLR